PRAGRALRVGAGPPGTGAARSAAAGPPRQPARPADVLRRTGGRHRGHPPVQAEHLLVRPSVPGRRGQYMAVAGGRRSAAADRSGRGVAGRTRPRGRPRRRPRGRAHRRRRPRDRPVRRRGRGDAGRLRPVRRPGGAPHRALRAAPHAADPGQLRARRRGRGPPHRSPAGTLPGDHRPRHQPRTPRRARGVGAPRGTAAGAGRAAAARRPRRGGPPRLPGVGRPRGVRGDLPAARRDAPRRRTRRRPAADAHPAPDRRPARRPLPPAHLGQPHGTAPAADPAGRRRLVLGPARRGRTRGAGTAVGVRGRLRPGRRRGGVRAGRPGGARLAGRQVARGRRSVRRLGDALPAAGDRRRVRARTPRRERRARGGGTRPPDALPRTGPHHRPVAARPAAGRRCRTAGTRVREPAHRAASRTRPARRAGGPVPGAVRRPVLADDRPAPPAPQQVAAVERPEREYENLRTALRHALALRDEQEALCLVLSLVRFWRMRDLRIEARNWCSEVASLGPDPFTEPVRPAAPVWEPLTAAPPPMTGEVLAEARRGVHLAHMACMDTELDDWQTPAAQHRLRVIAATYEPGLPQTCRSPGHLWAFAVMLTGDMERLRETIDAAIRTCRETPGFEWELATNLQMRANVLANRSDWAGDARRG